MADLKPPFTKELALLAASSIGAFKPEKANIQTTQPIDEHSPTSPNSSFDKAELQLPAAYHQANRFLELDTEDPASLTQYFAHEVNVSRLESVYRRLWMAGLMRPARPLSHQLMTGRMITPTGNAGLHLLWHKDRILIKPLPEFLLCHEVWTRSLCPDPELYARAAGMLLSNLWLVSTRNDLRTARQHGLLPDHISWTRWSTLCKQVLQRVDHHTFHRVSPRYRFGELRLQRVNWVYRFCARTDRFTSFIRGYTLLEHDYSTFIQRNTAWLVGLASYILLALTAMQVGLATTGLQANAPFQAASYGFTVFAILGPLVFLVGLFLYIAFLYMFNAVYAIKRRKGRKESPSKIDGF